MNKQVQEDLTGQKFGMLTVTGMTKIDMESEMRSGCHFRCDCGAMGTTIAKYLKRKSKRHCGSTECARKDKAARSVHEL